MKPCSWKLFSTQGHRSSSGNVIWSGKNWRAHVMQVAGGAAWSLVIYKCRIEGPLYKTLEGAYRGLVRAVKRIRVQVPR